VEEIEQILRDGFVSSVGGRFMASRTLEQFLEDTGVELPVLAEAEVAFMENEVEIDEVRKALASAKADSAPGPSGQTIAIFKYIFSQVPVLFTRAINELIFVPGLVGHPMFCWLQERKVVSIPKPGKVPDRVGNLRPLSLLETLYKILTRILSGRMAETMDGVLHPDQHGFRRDRGIQTATVPVLEAVKDAEKTGQPLQLLSIDLKAAFDTISPDVIYKVMTLEKYPQIFTDAMHQLTSEGRGRMYVQGFLGPQFEIKNGAGQGDPPSATRFNIGSDPVLRAAHLIAQQFRYVFSNGLRAPSKGYADDHLHPLNVTNAGQVGAIIDVYKKFKEVSGLQISIEKTKILCINTDPALMQEISDLTGVGVVNKLRFLGVEIRATYSESLKESFKTVDEGVQAKYDRINSAFLDLFHRRQLICSVLLPSYNHLFMAFGVQQDICDNLDKMVVKLLWTKKRGGQVKQGRRLVARGRIGASHQMGGLQVDSARVTARSLLLNTFQRLMAQSDLEPQQRTFMWELLRRDLEAIHAPGLSELLTHAGEKIWIQIGGKQSK